MKSLDQNFKHKSLQPKLQTERGILEKCFIPMDNLGQYHEDHEKEKSICS